MIERKLYLDKLISWKDKDIIKVITGIRRCGKSTLLNSFAEYLIKSEVDKQNIIQINLEDIKYDNMDYKTLYNLIEKKVLNNNDKTYIFLDEIQRINSWEKVINSLYLNKNIDIYITGSNAYLLSSELSTYLSGRFVEIKMLPLSFKEFLLFYEFDNISIERKFALYLKYGGMPSIANCNFIDSQVNDIFDSIYNTVLVKDIITRAEVKDIVVMQKLIKFLADNISNITSINNITSMLVNEKSLNKRNNKLIDYYVQLLENAYIFYKVQRYDIKGKDILKSLEKYYIVDSGLRYFLLGRISDTGRILENIVYFELLRRNYKVYIGKFDNKEIDFIAEKQGEKLYIQVSENISDPKTKERELNILSSINDNFTKILLTMDVLHTGITENGIKIVNIIDWLLE